MVMRLVRDDDPPFDEVEDEPGEPLAELAELPDRLKSKLGDVVDEHKARGQLVDQEELLTRHFGKLVQEQLAAAAAAAAMNDSEHRDGAVEGPGGDDDEQRAEASSEAAGGAELP